MAIADKLVLRRQRHLKWRALDRLELVLMLLCGILCFGFSLSVTADIVTRDHRPSMAVAAGGHLDAVHLRIFIGAAVATRRNDHLYLTAIAESMHGVSRMIVEIIIRLVVLGVALCLIWYGSSITSAASAASACHHDADRLALAAIPSAGVLIALFTVEQIVNGCATASIIPSRRR